MASDVRPIIARPHVSDADAGIHKWHHRLVSQMLILVHLMLDHVPVGGDLYFLKHWFCTPGWFKVT